MEAPPRPVKDILFEAAPNIEGDKPGGGSTDDPYDELRILRCDILALDQLAEAIRTGKARFEDNAAYIASVRDHAEGVLTAIEKSESKADMSGEKLRELRLSWDQLKQVPAIAKPDTPTGDGQQRLAQLNSVSLISREIIYELGYKTIPNRLNEWLAQAPPGYYVPFHTVFEDEVPNEADRNKILQFLAFQPAAVTNGLIDAANGLVYRYSPSSRRRWISLGLIALAFVVLTAIVANWGQIGRWTDKWPYEPGDWFDLLLIWLAVVAGVVVHMVVGAAKRIREQRALPPVFATNEVTKRINAREGLILVKMATALIGFFALLAADYLGDIEPLTAFLAGYALDSVVGLFATSLDAQAATQSDLLKQKLKATSS